MSIAAAAISVLAALALSPVPELDFLLQMSGVGGLVGLFVAARARGRPGALDSITITTRWTLGFALIGLLILLFGLIR